MSTLLLIPVAEPAIAAVLALAGDAALRTNSPTIAVNQISLGQAARTFDPATWSALQHGHGAAAVVIPAVLDAAGARAVRAYAFAAFTGRVAAFTTILCGPTGDAAERCIMRQEALDFIAILDMPKATVRHGQGELSPRAMAAGPRTPLVPPPVPATA